MRAILRYVLMAASRACVSACCIILLSTALAATCVANEIEGMKLGMSFDQIRKIAASRGYAFSNGPIPVEQRLDKLCVDEGRPLDRSMQGHFELNSTILQKQPA